MAQRTKSRVAGTLKQARKTRRPKLDAAAAAYEAKARREMRAFRRLKPALKQKYGVCFVVMHNGQCIDHGEDSSALAEKYSALSAK